MTLLTPPQYTSRSPASTQDKKRDTLVLAAHRSTLDPTILAGLPRTVTRIQPWSLYHRRLTSVMVLHGIKDPANALAAAVYTGVDLSVVCTSLLMESWGGENLWGSDPGGSACPVQWRGHEVTPSEWTVYWGNVARGLGNQGAGGMQLTSTGLQEMANSLGGCWLPGPNFKVGAIYMRQLLAATNGDVELAYQHYNGSGPAAVEYGYNAAALEAQLKKAFVAVR